MRPLPWSQSESRSPSSWRGSKLSARISRASSARGRTHSCGRAGPASALRPGKARGQKAQSTSRKQFRPKSFLGAKEQFLFSPCDECVFLRMRQSQVHSRTSKRPLLPSPDTGGDPRNSSILVVSRRIFQEGSWGLDPDQESGRCVRMSE